MACYAQSNESILNTIGRPAKWLVVGVGFDPSGYFLGGWNFFRRANQEIFGFSIFMV